MFMVLIIILWIENQSKPILLSNKFTYLKFWCNVLLLKGTFSSLKATLSPGFSSRNKPRDPLHNLICKNLGYDVIFVLKVQSDHTSTNARWPELTLRRPSGIVTTFVTLFEKLIQGHWWELTIQTYAEYIDIETTYARRGRTTSIPRPVLFDPPIKVLDKQSYGSDEELPRVRPFPRTLDVIMAIESILAHKGEVLVNQFNFIISVFLWIQSLCGYLYRFKILFNYWLYLIFSYFDICPYTLIPYLSWCVLVRAFDSRCWGPGFELLQRSIHQSWNSWRGWSAVGGSSHRQLKSVECALCWVYCVRGG